jgi:MOSC domain-containing protein YiiM
MITAQVLHIHIAPEAGVEMEELDVAELRVGEGIVGDRYRAGIGHYSIMPHQDRQVTLIESETLEALKRDHKIDLPPAESRRNITTRGVALNHLVGQYFKVGEVLLFGGRLNVPCRYLEELLEKPVFEPLINRSGLNARIIAGGFIRKGDFIVTSEAPGNGEGS